MKLDEIKVSKITTIDWDILKEPKKLSPVVLS